MGNDILDNQRLVFTIATNDPEPGINANNKEWLNPGGLRLHDFEFLTPMREVSPLEFCERMHDFCTLRRTEVTKCVLDSFFNCQAHE